MPRDGKTHAICWQAVRAFLENDPLLREVDGRMIAQSAAFVAGIFVIALAAKGAVVTWM